MTKKYYLGVDIGSTFSKAVILEEKELVSCEIIPSGGSYKNAADRVVTGALEKAGILLREIYGVVSTGCGGQSVEISGRFITDISCVSRGVFSLFPLARTVIDIGGQYSRIIRLNAVGRSTGFLISEKCAGGSGRFLQIIAHVLGVSFSELGLLSLKSEKMVSFNTGCAVFAETEVISRLAEGAKKEDIIAGVHIALAARIQSLVERMGLEREVVVTGGVAKDSGLAASLKLALNTEVLVPDEPQITTALGAALFAADASAN